MKKISRILLLLFMTAAVFQTAACSSTVPGESGNEGPVIAATSAKSEATAPTTTATTAASTEPAVPTLPTNTSGKVEIRTISTSLTYAYNSYLITSAEGETAVVDPALMPPKNKLQIDPVIICSTHKHDDHNDKTFTDSYDCEKVLSKEADVTVGGFHVYSILSAHDGDVISTTSGNKIFVFEVNGLRIAHMGDIGQTELTEEQLKQIGDIDIAFMQFENSYSTMTLDNEKGFKLIEQLNPKIIIPTHYTEKAIPVLTEKYGEITYVDDVLAVSKEDLPQDTLNVCIIRNNYIF